MKITILLFCILLIGCSPSPKQPQSNIIISQKNLPKVQRTALSIRDSSQKYTNPQFELVVTQNRSSISTTQRYNSDSIDYQSTKNLRFNQSNEFTTFKINNRIIEIKSSIWTIHNDKGHNNIVFEYRLFLSEENPNRAENPVRTQAFLLEAHVPYDDFDFDTLIQRFIYQPNHPQYDKMCYPLGNTSLANPLQPSEYVKAGMFRCMCPDGYVLVEKTVGNWFDEDYATLLFFWNWQNSARQDTMYIFQ